MYTLVVILHVIVSIALILIILLQTGKGSDIGAVFGGGGSNTLFGASGPASFLSRLTAGAAVVFMVTSLFLAYFAAYTAYLVLAGGSHDILPAFSAIMLGFVVPLTIVTLAVTMLRSRRRPRPG